jgi:putative transcriptional regulator
MSARVRRLCLALLVCASAAIAALPAARAADTSGPLILVAKPELGEFYRASVLFVRPIGNGQHIGFIINRPTPVTLARLFPDHAPSRKITDPVYLGGPMHSDTIFAVVHRDGNPGGHSMPLFGDMFLAVDVDVVDKIIEKAPAQARFIAGLVAWQPGELDSEVQRGFWYMADPDPELVFRKSYEGLWEDMVRRSAGGV